MSSAPSKDILELLATAKFRDIADRYYRRPMGSHLSRPSRENARAAARRYAVQHAQEFQPDGEGTLEGQIAMWFDGICRDARDATKHGKIPTGEQRKFDELVMAATKELRKVKKAITWHPSDEIEGRRLLPGDSDDIQGVASSIDREIDALDNPHRPGCECRPCMLCSWWAAQWTTPRNTGFMEVVDEEVAAAIAATFAEKIRISAGVTT